MTNELVTAIQGTRATLDEKMETSEVKLFSDTAPITAEQLNRCITPLLDAFYWIPCPLELDQMTLHKLCS